MKRADFAASGIAAVGPVATLRARRGRSSFAALAVGCAVIGLAAPASAHAIGLSRGEYVARADGIDVTLTFARGEVIAVVPELAGAGSLDDARLAAENAAISRGTIERVRVTSGAMPCSGELTRATLTEQDGLELRARYTCPSPGAIDVTLPLLDDLAFGHRHAAHVVAKGTTAADHLLSRREPSFPVARANDAPSSASSFERMRGFVRMGVEHILTGYDHLLFLFALVLAGGTIRSLALAITAFTVAHSITLGLAVLGFVSPPARFIEPAIALSVAYVGVENFFARPESRWRITFPFGLLHGFGFAGALGEIDVPRADVPWALFSFNVGVELGQLAWMIVLGLAMAELRRFDWFVKRAVPILSASVVAIGLAWFAGRVHEPVALAVHAAFTATRHG